MACLRNKVGVHLVYTSQNGKPLKIRVSEAQDQTSPCISPPRELQLRRKQPYIPYMKMVQPVSSLAPPPDSHFLVSERSAQSDDLDATLDRGSSRMDARSPVSHGPSLPMLCTMQTEMHCCRGREPRPVSCLALSFGCRAGRGRHLHKPTCAWGKIGSAGRLSWDGWMDGTGLAREGNGRHIPVALFCKIAAISLSLGNTQPWPTLQ
jgi:hypothetical protein